MGERSGSDPASSGGAAVRVELAFTRLVREIQGPLLNLAFKVLRDPVESEDVVIEVLTRLLPRTNEFESTGHFVSYARTAVRNLAVDRIRSRSFRDARRALRDTDSLERQRPDDPSSPVERMPDRAGDPEDQTAAEQRRRAVRQAVESLGEPKRTVVVMFYEHDRSYSEIAAELEVSLATVKRHLGSARLLLAARLRALHREDYVA